MAAGAASAFGAAGDCVAPGADGVVAAGVLGAAADGDDEFGLSLVTGGDVAGAG
ncbi:hypothetical protein [Hyphomicrobium album]|uniref:hypothetical protein n=1 Tax=Hyphomicrobium album TaxID=2665159 RepID=UPI001E601D2D|nr:hypothetical protein [Hyphomicrobium album]